MVITFHGRLPLGALLDGGLTPQPAPHQTSDSIANFTPPAPVWFTTAQKDKLDLNAEGRLVCWHAAQGGAVADLLPFNKTGNALDGASGQILFQEQTHGGLIIANQIPDLAPFTIGLIYQSDASADALSLFSLQAEGDSDYSYLSAESGSLRLAQRSGGTLSSAPDPGKCVLVVVASDGNTLRLAVNRSPAITSALTLPRGPLNLMLGCRGFSRPLYNKLGSFALSDVMIWPSDVLAQDFARAPSAALALWQERSRNGSQG